MCLSEPYAVRLPCTLCCSAVAASSCSLGQLLLTSLLLTSHAACMPGDFIVAFGLSPWATAHARVS